MTRDDQTVTAVGRSQPRPLDQAPKPPDAALAALFVRTAPLTGRPFFSALVEGLAESLGMDHVFVAFALDRPPTRVRVLASWCNGGERESWDYDLQDNPCLLPYRGARTILPCDVSSTFRRKAGSGYEAFLGVPLHDVDGSVIGHLAAYSVAPFSDVTALQRVIEGIAGRAEAETRRLIEDQALHRTLDALAEENRALAAASTTDLLTRVLNRRGLDDAMTREFNRARRHASSLGMIVVDIDHFKQVNDAHGHAVGDQLLTHVAGVLRQTSRTAVDTIGRFGGEEFVILVPGGTPTSTREAAGRLIEAVRASVCDSSAGALCVTISAGCTTVTPADVDPQQTFERADRALYHAKRSGRNQVCEATPS